jgi:hypothetical protein
MNAVELRELNDVLEEECGWQVQLGVSPATGEEFYCVYEFRNAESPGTELNSERVLTSFVGVMPICTTLGAFVSTASLCQHYYQKALSERTPLKR